jgi:hypothetical protein
MSEIHAEITELGEDKIYRIEEIINRLRAANIKDDRILMDLYKEYFITTNTGIMLIAGAKEHKYSKMLRRQLDD